MKERRKKKSLNNRYIIGRAQLALLYLCFFFFCAEHEVHKSLLVSCSKTCSGITHKQSCALNLRNTAAVILAFTREHCSRKNTHIYISVAAPFVHRKTQVLSICSVFLFFSFFFFSYISSFFFFWRLFLLLSGGSGSAPHLQQTRMPIERQWKEKREKKKKRTQKQHRKRSQLDQYAKGDYFRQQINK